MATQAHCAFCFETLSAHFDNRQPLSLSQVEELWEQYHATNVNSPKAEEEETTDVENDEALRPAKPAGIARLLNSARSATSSSSSLPSTSSGASSTGSRSTGESAATTPSSSEVSLPSTKQKKREKHPLFVTWNKHSARSGHKSLRGCIGTFGALELEHGLSSYALTR